MIKCSFTINSHGAFPCVIRVNVMPFSNSTIIVKFMVFYQGEVVRECE